MSAFAELLGRRSVPAQLLAEPGPDEAQVTSAIELALRAPDHGRVQPWRFRLVRGAARARFADLLASTALAQDPATPATQLDKLRSRALQAPLTVIATARLRPHPKVPEIEQLMSAGAGVMNLLNAFYLQGFGAIWLTGPPAYNAALLAALGLEPGERLLGFVYVGTPTGALPNAPARPQAAGFVSEWVG